MQVILTKPIPGVGYTGDLKNVKPGYFRNYLFPQNMAVIATKGMVTKYEEMKEQIVKEKAELTEKASESIEKLKDITLTFVEKVSEKGTLYGAISIDRVLELLKEESKMDLDKDVVSIDGGSIKETGEFTATVRLTDENKCEIKIIVVAEEE